MNHPGWGEARSYGGGAPSGRPSRASAEGVPSLEWRVTCIRRGEPHRDHGAIVGIGTNGLHWSLREILAALDSGRVRFYVLDAAEARRAYLQACDCPAVAHRHVGLADESPDAPALHALPDC